MNLDNIDTAAREAYAAGQQAAFMGLEANCPIEHHYHLHLWHKGYEDEQIKGLRRSGIQRLVHSRPLERHVTWIRPDACKLVEPAPTSFFPSWRDGLRVLVFGCVVLFFLVQC